MNASATADPVRAQVEDALRHVVDAVTAVPCELNRRARKATGEAVDRFTETVSTAVGLARSVAELALGGLLGRAPSEPASPAARPTSSVPGQRPRVDVPGDSGAPVDTSVDSAASDLPLEGYESLAASHVVARLARLSHDELELIRAFEQAHRGRRTILGKIEQLRHA